MDGLELDLDTDIDIDVTDLPKEWKRLPALAYRYSELKAEADEVYGLEKAKLEEMKSELYCKIKGSGEKVTVDHLKAMIETDEGIKKQLRVMLTAKRDSDTIRGYLDGIKIKESMLIQLGAASRVS